MATIQPECRSSNQKVSEVFGTTQVMRKMEDFARKKLDSDEYKLLDLMASYVNSHPWPAAAPKYEAGTFVRSLVNLLKACHEYDIKGRAPGDRGGARRAPVRVKMTMNGVRRCLKKFVELKLLFQYDQHDPRTKRTFYLYWMPGVGPYDPELDRLWDENFGLEGIGSPHTGQSRGDTPNPGVDQGGW